MFSEFKMLLLYNAHRGDLVNYANKILRDRSSAEDVVQEAYLRFSKASKTQILVEPAAYLQRIVRNLCLDMKRKTQREQARMIDTDEGSLESVRETRPSPESQVAAREELHLLRQALAELPERTRKAVEMYWYHDDTMRDVAEHLGISLGLTHSLVADGLEHCRVRLNRTHPKASPKTTSSKKAMPPTKAIPPEKE